MTLAKQGLTLVHQNNCAKKLGSNTVFLLCVFRDESILLKYFIEYYQALGVTHFIMVDNSSIDDGVNYLRKLKNINIRIYHTSESYRDANYGTTWVNTLLEMHCRDKYCLVVDVDELFYFDKDRFSDLYQLIENMEYHDSNVVPTTLLDMYPDKTNDSYQKGQDFLMHSPFFDKHNTDYYKVLFSIYKSFSHITGGVRERIFDKTVCIHKFPFFKYNFKSVTVAAGCHYFQDRNGEVIKDTQEVKLFDVPAILLHFKFIKPSLRKFFENRVSINQDWDESSEYKSYANIMRNNSSLKLFDENYSRKFKDSQSLRFFFDI